MTKPVRFHRTALVQLLRTSWDEVWLVSPRIQAEAAALMMPFLKARGGRIRVLTRLDVAWAAAGEVDLAAVQALRNLPGCEVRHLADLDACIYAAVPGTALVTSAPLTLDGLDGTHCCGTWVDDSQELFPDLQQWWDEAAVLTEPEWADLAVQTSLRMESRSLGEEIGRVGAFVRVSVRGSRRSRRLDPREYGVPAGLWGQAVRPVEVALYRLDDVVRAKEELEAVLAERGLEWRGYYLVPRGFLERDWPRIFAARSTQLRERLLSPEGRENLKRQLAEARRELEAFFAEIYSRAETGDAPAEVWIRNQVNRVLDEIQDEAVLEESGLEYRVLLLQPEDERSVAEIRELLQDPKLRSVQLTFQI